MAGLELMGRPRDDAAGQGGPWRDAGIAPSSRGRSCSRATPSRPTPTASAGRPTHGGFFEYGVAGRDDGGLRAMAQQFAGAWPYLQLIAGGHRPGRPAGPPGRRGLLGRQPAAGPGRHPLGRRLDGGPVPVHDRRAGSPASPRACSPGECRTTASPSSASTRTPACSPTGRKAPHALTVLDRCRIRWGRVLAVQGDQVVVESRSLTWDGDGLALGRAGDRDRRAVGRRRRDGGRRRAGGLGVPALGVGLRPADRAAGGPAARLHRAAPGDRQRRRPAPRATLLG